MTRQRRAKRGRWLSAVALSAVAAAGCGSHQPTSSTPLPVTSAAVAASASGSPATSPTTPTTTATTSATDPAVPASATGIATDPQGDAVTVSITVGSPTPANELSDPAVLDCAGALASDGSSLDRSIAVPVTAQVKLTTQSPVKFQLQLNYVASVHQGAANLDKDVYATSATAPFWAMAFSSGPLCSSESPTGGLVSWSSLVPGIPTTWSAWMILAEQNTPNSPDLDSLDSFTNTLLLQPDFYLGAGGIEELGLDGPSSVTCANGGFIAVDPIAAKGQGCT